MQIPDSLTSRTKANKSALQNYMILPSTENDRFSQYMQRELVDSQVENIEAKSKSYKQLAPHYRNYASNNFNDGSTIVKTKMIRIP